MKLNKDHQRFITATILATIFWLIFFYCKPIIFSIVLIGILITIIVKEWTIIFKNNRILYWLIMPLYPILPFMLLLYMNHHPLYHNLVYHLFLIVFSFDTSAYITGTLIGSYKILPSISPQKTIEGCIGGFIGALIMFYISIYLEFGTITSYIWTNLIILITCCIAFWGDIFESLLKRQAHIKDSGNALPGHGGFLDRFDAVMMVTFFFFICKNQLIKLLP